jgi:cytochrome P450
MPIYSDPERWIEADPSTRAKYERQTEVIFGSGRYICLGKNVAWIELSKAFVEVCAPVFFSNVSKLTSP